MARRRVYLDAQAGYQDCGVFHRDDLRPGHSLAGPAVVVQTDTTVFIPADHAGHVTPHGVIRISRR